MQNHHALILLEAKGNFSLHLMDHPLLLNIRHKAFDLTCFSWVEWHHRFQKLHQQAVLEGASYSEELTKDALISHGKVRKSKYMIFKHLFYAINY